LLGKDKRRLIEELEDGMAFFEKLLGIFTSQPKMMKVRVTCERREGGYVRVYSKDIKGFRLMLDPALAMDKVSLRAAIQGPLETFADAYFSAKNEAARANRSRFKVVDLSSEVNSEGDFLATISGNFRALGHC
jgi:hypothetical protein